MKLSRPAAPFERVELHGESFTLDTSGKVLVLPTENAAVLPSYNEYVLNPNRLTIAESPFGGLKGSGSPDYCPGTLFCQTDGVYLTDTSGTNSTKTLTAGKLNELSLLTVDPVAHTITEEFMVANTATSNNPTVIMPVSATGWDFVLGSGTITVENGRLKVVGTCNTAGSLRIRQTGLSINIASYEFIRFQIESSVPSKLGCLVYTNAGYKDYTSWKGDRFPFFSNTTFALPVKAPVGSAGQNPDSIVGTQDWGAVTNMQFGVYGLGDGENVTFYVGDITADTAKTAYIELQTPNNLADSSLTLQAWDGSAYQTTGVYKLDSSYSAVSTTTENWKLADGTKFDDCYGSGNGRALFPKGASAETKAGSSGSITYSANKGTSKRIGFRVDLPPSDGGRTNFNKCRMKAILSYAPDAENDYSASFDFADSTNASYGLQNLSLPWVALYDPADSLIDFYLFTHRPQNLSFKRNDDGTIHEVTLYPGNGLIYHGQITYANLTADSNSDGIPDCLEASVEGSLTKFLQAYGMVI